MSPALALLLAVPAPMSHEPAPTFTDAGHTTDTLEVVKERVRDGSAVLVDVREREEWDAGHLERATLVPLSEIAKGWRTDEYTADLAKQLPKDRPVYTHCKSGGRCVLAADPLRELGYDVRPLKAGFEELAESGFDRAE